MHVGMRQYWRDANSLLEWTRSDPHRQWWQSFLKDSGGTGFWHETSFPRGGIEAVYDDVPENIGLMLLCYKRGQLLVKLFCGQTLFARPTGEALCGLYGWPGASRGARRSGNAVEAVLRRIAVAGRTQKRGAKGGPSGTRQCAADASVAAPRSGGRAVER